MKKETLFSTGNDNWKTPDSVFETLDQEFHFTLDPCASEENHICPKYYTKEQDGLRASWGGETVFCNPPYSDITNWVKKAYEESLKPGTTVVLLIPARTDTKYFHNYILHRSEIRFIKGRLKFSGAQYNAPFPSMIVIFRAACI